MLSCDLLQEKEEDVKVTQIEKVLRAQREKEEKERKEKERLEKLAQKTEPQGKFVVFTHHKITGVN